MEERPRVPISTDKSAGLCIGCGQNNPYGLKLSFQWDGRGVVAEFTPGKHYQGWQRVVHGGIIASMLDEAMSYAIHFTGKSCLTAEMEIKFKCLALVGEPLVITASITKKYEKVNQGQGEGLFTRWYLGSPRHGDAVCH